MTEPPSANIIYVHVAPETLDELHRLMGFGVCTLSEAVDRLVARGAAAGTEPTWASDETRTEWAIRSTGTNGLVVVGAPVAEEVARRWAHLFPRQHPHEIASAEVVSRIVQHRETDWEPS